MGSMFLRFPDVVVMGSRYTYFHTSSCCAADPSMNEGVSTGTGEVGDGYGLYYLL